MSQPEPTSDSPSSPPASPSPPPPEPQPSFAVPFPQQADPVSTQFTVDNGFAASAPVRPAVVSAASALMAVECLVGLVLTAALAAYSFGGIGPYGGYVAPEVILAIFLVAAATCGYVAMTVFVFLGRDGARITTFSLSGLLSGLGLFGSIAFLITLADSVAYYSPFTWMDYLLFATCVVTFLVTVTSIVLLGLGPSARWFARMRDARSRRF